MNKAQGPFAKQTSIDRRQFLGQLTASTSAIVLATSNGFGASDPPTARHLPKWRGFNLLEKFTPRQNAPFQEADFEMMAQWGFNFARLPLSYHCWASPEDWLNWNEKVLKEIDQAVYFGKQHGVHVNINLHRAPGYCVNPPKEPKDLWKDAEAREAACESWARLAARYKGIPNAEVSFDLLNEPAQVEESVYANVVESMVKAIRDVDPQRLIVADGLQYGRDPVHGLIDLGIAQSTRGYDPMRISHHRANWIQGSDRWETPAWPLKQGDRIQDRQWFKEQHIEPWKALERQGVGVHVGEWGCYNKTPHKVALAWMKDLLELWKEANWGWALWNLRGSFGILDSQRDDVSHENHKGHQLDRRMLELLQNIQ